MSLLAINISNNYFDLKNILFKVLFVAFFFSLLVNVFFNIKETYEIQLLVH